MTTPVGYDSRAGRPRAASGGVATRPLGGLGKLNSGTHRLEVLSVSRGPLATTVLLVAPTGEVHHEQVTTWPPTTTAPGTKVLARVVVGPGFAVERDVARWRGVDGPTRAPLTDWHEEVRTVYDLLLARGLTPSTTQLDEITHDGIVTRLTVAQADGPAGPAARATPDPDAAVADQPANGPGSPAGAAVP